MGIKVEFKTEKEFINWLIDNEGQILADAYGRQWKYKNYTFYYKDILSTAQFQKDKLSCLHLCETEMYHLQEVQDDK